MPALILVAEHDYTPLAWKQQMRDALPSAELAVVPGSHHATPVELPETFNRLTSAFLRKVDPHA